MSRNKKIPESPKENHHDDCGCSDSIKEEKHSSDCVCDSEPEKDEICLVEETEDSCGCGCSDDDASVKESSDTCSIDSSCATCGCEEGLLEEKEQLWDKKPLMIISSSVVLLGIGLYLDFFTGSSLLSQSLFLLVIVISGFEIIKNGLKGLLKGHFTMNFLMTLAVLGSFLIGSGAEGAVVIFLFYIALYLENYAGERARKSIAALLKLAPETATLKRDGKTSTVHVHEVRAGDVVIVRPGDKIPLDGQVIDGISSVNEAAITGESMPVTKTMGALVFAGTLNGEGYLEVEVTKKSDETVLSKIVELVKESENKKSKTETFIDKLARYYTPLVIALAAMVALVPVLLGQPLDVWVYRALVLLIISCPCAFLLSTPVSMVSAVTAATRNGVLIKGSRYVEEMDKVQVMVFDKTGTLTEGELEVTDVINLNGYSYEEVLSITGALESKSKHPIARAMVRHLEETSTVFKEVGDFESVTGKGVKGEINGNIFYMGEKSFFEGDYQFPEDLMHELQNEGKTTVLLGNDQEIVGLIGLRDRIRNLSKSTVAELKDNGIKTVMLTGDHERTAHNVSSELGLDEYYAGLMPEDKVRIMEELLDKYQYVAMVGDGVNDAPALARSNVGIAMGAAGSDVAIETADVALMHDDISKINYLLNLSKKTMGVVKQNVSIALIVQISLAILAVFGYVSLWMAVTLGDMGLTLAVILNALRIGNK